MSWQTIYNNTMTSLRYQTQMIAKLQEQAASGARVLRASDQPSDAFSILSLKSQSRSLEVYGRNISHVITDMEQSSNSLNQVSSAIIRVKQLLTQAASQTYGSDNLQSIGGEINSLLEHVVALVNVKNLEHYVFGGSNISELPYEVQRQSGKISSVSYKGSTDPLSAAVAPGVTDSGTVVGQKIFQVDNRQTPVLLGRTGLAAGSGTSNARGDQWLTVSHELTTYGGLSGIAAGASSVAGDTIAGSNHKLYIDADAKTITLDDGQAVSYTNLSEDIAVSNSSGETVYVNCTNLAAGLSGLNEVAVNVTSRLSLDDGATSVVANSTANQAVVDSRTGKMLYVDSRALIRTGTEPIRVPGTHDLFNMLVSVRDLLQGDRPISDSARSDLLNKSILSVGEVMQNVTAGISSLGARLQVIESRQQSISFLVDSTRSQTGQLQDADIAEVAGEMAKFQMFYQMTLTSASRVLNMSLLDFLQ